MAGDGSNHMAIELYTRIDETGQRGNLDKTLHTEIGHSFSVTRPPKGRQSSVPLLASSSSRSTGGLLRFESAPGQPL